MNAARPGKDRRTLRKEWSRENGGKPWPKDKAGKNHEAHHDVAKADGGEDHGRNIIPMPKDEHTKLRKENGDFKRWNKRRGQGGQSNKGI